MSSKVKIEWNWSAWNKMRKDSALQNFIQAQASRMAEASDGDAEVFNSSTRTVGIVVSDNKDNSLLKAVRR